jgi:hypothetical protein
MPPDSYLRLKPELLEDDFDCVDRSSAIEPNADR